jgi:hypothetical protein
VLESLPNADWHLRIQAVIDRINWRANNGRKAGSDQLPAADYNEDAKSLWISRRGLVNPIQISSFHRAIW